MPISGPTEQEVSPRIELGLGYGKHFGDQWQWITELSGDVHTDSDSGEYDRANLTSGGRYYFGDAEKWAFNFGLRIDVSENDLDDTAPIGGLVGITYSSPTRPHPHPARSAAAAAAAPVSPAPPPAQHRRRRRPRVPRRTRSRCARPAPATDWSPAPRRESTAAPIATRDMRPAPRSVSPASPTPARPSTASAATARRRQRDDVERPHLHRRLQRQADAADVRGLRKYGAWDCQSGLRETVPFTTGGAMLGPGAVTASGRGVLCDWANQLRACPQLRLCVAGSTAASEEACVASQRADTLVQFFRRQSGENAFSGIASRVQAAPSCSPDDEKGSLGNLQMR